MATDRVKSECVFHADALSFSHAADLNFPHIKKTK